MNKKEKLPFEIYADLLSTNRRMYEKINWQETFIEYIKKNNSKLYKKAKEHTDELEANDYFTEEERIKWGMK